MERLRTYSHCGQCLLFIDHLGPGDTDIYDGLYEAHPNRLAQQFEKEKCFENELTERNEKNENESNGNFDGEYRKRHSEPSLG
jgi:hypothetical protein